MLIKTLEMLIDSVTRAVKNKEVSAEERMLCVLDEHLQFIPSLTKMITA